MGRRRCKEPPHPLRRPPLPQPPPSQHEERDRHQIGRCGKPRELDHQQRRVKLGFARGGERCCSQHDKERHAHQGQHDKEKDRHAAFSWVASTARSRKCSASNPNAMGRINPIQASQIVSAA